LGIQWQVRKKYSQKNISLHTSWIRIWKRFNILKSGGYNLNVLNFKRFQREKKQEIAMDSITLWSSLNIYVLQHNNIYLVRDVDPPHNQFFSQFFLSLSRWKIITNFLLVQNRFFFLSFGPMKSLLSFSTAQTEKILWK
jgi:hypothetical protein